MSNIHALRGSLFDFNVLILQLIGIEIEDDQGRPLELISVDFLSIFG